VLDKLTKLAIAAFPSRSPRGRFVRRLLPEALTSGVVAAYQHYIAAVEPLQWSAPVAVTASSARPLLSVIVPMFNTPDAYVRPLFDSLSNQTYPNFEAIVADASTQADRSAAIARAAASDPRLRYVRLDNNSGIAANTNAALAHATAPYITFVDHDDVLSLHALNEVTARLADDPAIDILYSDEDVLSDNGWRRQTPFFKPIWSPHMFLECNYTNHLSVIRRSLIDAVGGLRPDLDGAQDYDLLLRIHSLPDAPRVAHIPAVLYHWREAATSTALKMDTKDYAIEAGRRALAEHLQRLGVACDGIDDVYLQPGWYRVKPRWKASVAVVCARAAAGRLDALKTATKAAECRPTWHRQPAGLDVTALGDFDAVVLVEQPYLPDDPTWLDDLVGALALPGATVVAPLLVGPSGRVDTAGFALDGLGLTNVMNRALASSGDLNGTARTLRDVDAVSRAFVAVKRADIDLLTGRGADPLVAVPADRGYAVVWAHQMVTRRQDLRHDGFVNANVGFGAMGWMRQR